MKMKKVEKFGSRNSTVVPIPISLKVKLILSNPSLTNCDMCLSGKAFALHTKGQVFGCKRPKLFKTSSKSSSAKRLAQMSILRVRVFEKHKYFLCYNMCCTPRNPHCSMVMSLEILQLFTGKCDVSIPVKIIQRDEKQHSNKLFLKIKLTKELEQFI